MRSEPRIADDDRNSAIERLKVATGDGRLTLDEFSDRLDIVFASRTASDLVPAFAGLPDVPKPTELEPSPAAGVEVAAVPKPQRIVALMSGARRVGRWRVPTRLTVFAFWGGVRLDLQDAVLEGPSVDITAWAIMGGVEIRVPDNVVVELDGMVVMGGSDNRSRPATTEEGAPLIRVHCRGMWGSVDVRPAKRRDRVRQRAGQIVDQILDVVDPPSLPATQSNATVSILVTDIVGSTALSERLGDQRWLGVLQSHNALVREQLGRHDGTEVKQLGDGFIATFGSSRDAVRAANGIRRAMEGYCVGHPDSPLELRIAVHAGEVAREGGDVFGLNVSTASHLADVTPPGEVLVSAVVRELAGSTTDLDFGPPREVAVAGRAAPMVVHPVLRGRSA